VLIAVIYFINRNSIPYLVGGYDAATYGADYFARFAPTVLLHLIPASIAALLGPFQFMSVIRDRFPRFHRTSGRVYLSAVAIAGIVSFDLSVNLIMRSPERMLDRVQSYGVSVIPGNHFYAYGTGLAFLSVAWLTTLFVAVAAIRQGRITLHKEWMRRNYIVTLGFIFYRIGYIILFKRLHVDYYEVINIMAWSCWSVPLLINEFIQGVGRLREPVAPAAAARSEAMG
jgi:uncharacterized membrane protein